MKKVLCFIFICLFSVMSINAKEKKEDVTKKSESSILIEATTGKVLFEKNPDKKLPPASMTKVMTMLLLMEAIEDGKIKLTDKVLISKNAASMGGSQIFIEENSSVTIRDLLKGISIASANDAAVAIAEKLGGTEENFVNMMNERAKKLGLKNTNFKNPHGLDENGHLTSARDLAIISRELVRHEDILKFTSTYEEYMTRKNGEKFWLVNTNKLIRFYDGMDGLKTGYTPKAGYGLIATVNKNNMRLISVVMKTSSTEERSSETIALMEYGYSMFGSETLISKKKKIGDIYIPNSKNRTYPFYLKDDVKLISKKGESKVKYRYKIKLYNVKAPLRKGSKVGKLKLTTNEGIRNYDLVVNKKIDKSSYLKLLLNNFKDIVSGTVNVL